MSLAWWWNTSWMVSCLPELRSFYRATKRVADSQHTLLLKTLRANAETVFGRRHRFGNIRDVREFQRAVPLTTYLDYRESVERIAAGEPDVLTRDHVMLFEPTSGTNGGEKLIPYTRGLRAQFQKAISAWIGDLFWQHPAVRNGRSYWSVSPAGTKPRTTAAGIPIGFDHDAAYLGFFSRLVANRVLVVPPSVGVPADQDLREFKLATLSSLLLAEDLTLISVWSPTFLSALFSDFDARLEGITVRLRQNKSRRARFVIDVLNRDATLAERLQMCWPRLALISCWTDAAAALSLHEVTSLFPGVEIQPKGLLATEGAVTFPLVRQVAPALAIRSHFFEFEELTNCSNLPCLAHELEKGGRYRVMITTAGGLYRYQLRDEVEVVGFLGQCPLLRFLGKSDRVSDRVGEKLAEPHVREVIERAITRFGLSPKFVMVAPRLGQPDSYVVYWQNSTGIAPNELLPLLAAIDDGLRKNPYYRHAVDFGQLAELELCLLREDAPVRETFEAVYVGRGQRVGDIKPMCLETGTEWHNHLKVFLKETIGSHSTPTAIQK